MIKIIKRKRKNPNLKGEEFIDDIFMNHLMRGMLSSNLDIGNDHLAKALVYKNIGDSPCEDCSDGYNNVYYDECRCEYCEDCDHNQCTCELNSLEKLHNYIIQKVIKYLNKKQISEFSDMLSNNNYKGRFDFQIKKLNNL